MKIIIEYLYYRSFQALTFEKMKKFQNNKFRIKDIKSKRNFINEHDVKLRIK